MKQRRAFVLPLVLIFLLVGGALIAASLDIATNSQNQAMQMVTTGTLYNAAQSGLEWGKSQLLKHKENLDQSSSPGYTVGVSSLSDLYATYTPSGGSSKRVDEVLSGSSPKSLPINGIPVSIIILDCNYSVFGTPSATDDLPPLMPSTTTGSGGTGSTGATGFTDGTTVIMDPTRVVTSGGGGYTQHYYVIRSTATDDDSGRKKSIEALVVING